MNNFRLYFMNLNLINFMHLLNLNSNVNSQREADMAKPTFRFVKQFFN